MYVIVYFFNYLIKIDFLKLILFKIDFILN